MWHALILEYAEAHSSGHLTWEACGFCRECHQDVTKLVWKHSRHGGVAHGLELSPANRALLRWLAKRANATDVMQVHDYAATNTTGVVAFQSRHSRLIGSETNHLCDTKWSHTGLSRCDGDSEAALAISLDDFALLHGLNTIYQLSIDVEGWEPLVLEGAKGLIHSRRIELIEFEYSGHGYWTHPSLSERRTLNHTLDWLYRAHFDCFYQTLGGLIAASGYCWKPEMEIQRWSNLVCAHSPKHKRRLWGLTLAELQKRRGPKG